MQSVIGPDHPFTNIVVLPSYGFATCVIKWNLAPKYNRDNYRINIYKSRDGFTDWFKLNENLIDPVINAINDTQRYYTDDKFVNRNQFFNWHYKLELLQWKNSVNNYVSVCMTPSVGVYETLDSAEFSTLRSMIQNEFIQKDSINVFLMRPKGLAGKDIMDEANPTPKVDYLTQEHIGGSTDTESFGQTFLQGYSNPILTQITIDKYVQKLIDDQQGHGSSDTTQVAITGFSYPRPIKGDMIILPQTDARYFFTDYTEEYLFKGLFPFKYTGIMKLIPRNQVEYKIPVRDLKNCCINHYIDCTQH